MTIIKCDRCGAEIDPCQLRKVYENGKISMSVVDNCRRDYDLCLNCLHDLEKWMKGRENKQ